MAISKMKKLTLAGVHARRDPVLSLLQELGCVELIDFDGEREETRLLSALDMEGQLADLAVQLSSLTRAIDALDRVSPEKSSMFAVQPSMEQSAAEQILDRTQDLLAVCTEIEGAQDEIVAEKARQARLTGNLGQLAPYTAFDLTKEQLGTHGTTVSVFGNVPQNAADALIEALQELGPVHAEKIGRDKDQVGLYVLSHRSILEEVNQALRKEGFAQLTLPGDGTPSEAIRAFEQELRESEQKQAACDQRILSCVDSRMDLKVLFDQLQQRYDRIAASAQALGSSKETFLLEAWLAADNQPFVEKSIMELAGDIYLEFDDPAQDEVPPTFLVNSKTVKPFEMVTDMFSSPAQSDIDPNKHMFPFFVAFYGMMMSDAGYGLIMAIGGYLFNKILKPKGSLKSIATIVSYGGIGAIFWGILFSSYFAIEGIEPILFSPIYDPLPMLGMCFGLGAVHIFYGMGIAAMRAIKAGDWQTALFDNFSWMFLIIGLVMLVLPATAFVGKIMAIAGFAMLLLFGGRQHKWNIPKRIFGGLGKLYNITSYLSDILSYSRLFAMGLATAAIGMVFNSIAGLLLASPIGFIFGVAVLIVGHVFNLGINALGGYVHTCRLQYIEFFGKFYEGGGVLFRPFQKRTKYVNILNQTKLGG